MTAIFETVLLASAGLLAIPVFVLLIEIIAALALAKPTGMRHIKSTKRPPIAVLVPAHNESAGLRTDPRGHTDATTAR